MQRLLLSAIPGLLFVAWGFIGHNPPSYAFIAVGAVLTVVLPFLFSGRLKLSVPEEIVPRLGMTQTQWNALVEKRRQMATRFVVKYREAGAFEIPGHHLEALAAQTDTDEMWRLIEVALDESANNQETRLAAAHRAAELSQAHQI